MRYHSRDRRWEGIVGGKRGNCFDILLGKRDVNCFWGLNSLSCRAFSTSYPLAAALVCNCYSFYLLVSVTPTCPNMPSSCDAETQEYFMTCWIYDRWENSKWICKRKSSKHFASDDNLHRFSVLCKCWVFTQWEGHQHCNIKWQKRILEGCRAWLSGNLALLLLRWWSWTYSKVRL